MTELMCLYVCVTVVLIVLILAIAYIYVDGVMANKSVIESSQLDHEIRRLQEQCNILYALINETKEKNNEILFWLRDARVMTAEELN